MSKKLLVVDDDPLIRRLVTATLRDVGGFELHEADSGEAALVSAQILAPSVIFLDCQMGGIDGIETCRRLRETESGSQATVVMLTGSGDEHTEGRAREAGVDLFLTKPFSPLDLLRLVDSLGASAP